jgi:hypothetical protein
MDISDSIENKLEKIELSEKADCDGKIDLEHLNEESIPEKAASVINTANTQSSGQIDLNEEIDTGDSYSENSPENEIKQETVEKMEIAETNQTDSPQIGGDKKSPSPIVRTIINELSNSEQHTEKHINKTKTRRQKVSRATTLKETTTLPVNKNKQGRRTFKANTDGIVEKSRVRKSRFRKRSDMVVP